MKNRKRYICDKELIILGKEYIINYKQEREKEIIKTSMVGLISNIILSVFKILTGLLSHSTVIILDGVETLSNAFGSILTIIGIKLSGKAPDKKHPLGYGRIEYISDLLVASLVMYIGFTAFIAGVGSIIHREHTEHSYIAYIILSISAVVKLILAKHEKETGFRLKSRSLVGAAVDSLANALVSISILISALIYVKFNIRLENYISVIISLLIIRGGIIMLKDTLGEILGKTVSIEFSGEIKDTMLEFDEVLGVHDLILHSYGRDRYVGSAHIEIPSSISTLELDRLERKIGKKVYNEHGVVLAGISIYAVNVDDEQVYAMYQFIKQFVMSIDRVLDVHGILIDKLDKSIYFDVIIDFEVENTQQIIQQIMAGISQQYSDYKVHIQNDIDI